MELAELIDAAQAEGERMADALEAAELDAPVPTCPEWAARDLALHLGGVHRWATAFVAEAKTEASDVDFASAVGPAPDDDSLHAWFRDGHTALITALRQAPPDLACWSFLPAPSPLAFWARRQAHETAIHRVDAELAAGLTPARVTPEFGTDGIDELLTGFVPRRQGDPRADPAHTLAVRCDDADAAWRVTISTETTSSGPDDATEADCIVHGDAAALYYALWNRLSTEALRVEGDTSALDFFLSGTTVRWSI